MRDNKNADIGNRKADFDTVEMLLKDMSVNDIPPEFISKLKHHANIIRFGDLKK